MIVTFMGDAIGPRGGVVSAAALQGLMQRMGIGAGAVRTAVSRLSAEGWIERSREGRNSFYQLSGAVGETVRVAERRIYAASSLLPADTQRTLVIAPGPLPETALQVLEAEGALQIAPQVMLVFTRLDSLPADLVLFGATLAEAPVIVAGASMCTHIAAVRQADEIESLRQAYLPVAAVLKQVPAPSPEDAMALRCLMIHEWRRLALRVQSIPADLIQPDDPEPATRALIAQIYAELLPASEAWLDDNATTPSGALPPPDARLASRFGG
ncbi:MAG: phenylacetic acid degradation operon negative regulatory protein PaaX [Hoeflea alexandrii]